MATDLDPVALDRHITGNYGLDQFDDDDESEVDDDRTEAEAWWDEHEDEVREGIAVGDLDERGRLIDGGM